MNQIVRKKVGPWMVNPISSTKDLKELYREMLRRDRSEPYNEPYHEFVFNRALLCLLAVSAVVSWITWKLLHAWLFH